MTTATNIQPGDARTIVITHRYSAQRALVFEACINSKHLLHWHYAAEGWTTPFAETDPRAGGKFRIGFKSPDGKNDFTFEGTYHEVTAPERIVYSIADGRPVTLTFTEEADKTRLDLNLTLENVYSEAQQREGWSAMLKNLDTYLATLS